MKVEKQIRVIERPPWQQRELEDGEIWRPADQLEAVVVIHIKDDVV